MSRNGSKFCLLSSSQLFIVFHVQVSTWCRQCCSYRTILATVSVSVSFLSLYYLKIMSVTSGPYLAEGRMELSGLSISRKLVSKVFRDDCALEQLEDCFWFPSLPCSILIASCMAKMTSCILGLEAPCCCTHCMATSAILHTDSIFTFPSRNGSTTLVTSPLWTKDLACINQSIVSRLKNYDVTAQTHRSQILSSLSFKTRLLGRGFHTLIRNVSFQFRRQGVETSPQQMRFKTLRGSP